MKILLSFFVVVLVSLLAEPSCGLKIGKAKCPMVSELQSCKKDCMKENSINVTTIASFVKAMLDPAYELGDSEEVMVFFDCMFVKLGIMTKTVDGEIEFDQNSMVKIVAKLSQSDPDFIKTFGKEIADCPADKEENPAPEVIKAQFLCYIGALDKACDSTLFLDVLLAVV